MGQYDLCNAHNLEYFVSGLWRVPGPGTLQTRIAFYIVFEPTVDLREFKIFARLSG